MKPGWVKLDERIALEQKGRNRPDVITALVVMRDNAIREDRNRKLGVWAGKFLSTHRRYMAIHGEDGFLRVEPKTIREFLMRAYVRGWAAGLTGITNDDGKIAAADELLKELTGE